MVGKGGINGKNQLEVFKCTMIAPFAPFEP